MRGIRLATPIVLVGLLAAACSSSGSTSSSTTTTSASTSTTAATGATSGTPTTTGITATQVKTANISILSGPIPGLFQGAPYGVEAYYAYVNSTGGVFGRKLELSSQDDAFSCSQNQSLTQGDIGTYTAFVGSFSLFDNCGARVLGNSTDVPDVAYSLDPVAQALVNNFSPQPEGMGWRTGPIEYYKSRYPDAVKAVGALVGNVASAIASWNYQKAAMLSIGYNVTYEQTVSPLQQDFTSYVLAMKSAGVKLIYLTDEDINSIARIMNTLQQQDYHPLLISEGTFYDGKLFKLITPGAANGALNDQQQALYLGGDKATVPAVSTLLTWLNRTHPGFEPDIFTVFGWTAAVLFVQALRSAGPNPTRASILNALHNITSFNADGLLATGNPAQKKAPTCWLLIQVQNNQYVRESPPNQGFRCDGSFHSGTSTAAASPTTATTG